MPAIDRPASSSCGGGHLEGEFVDGPDGLVLTIGLALWNTGVAYLTGLKLYQAARRHFIRP